MSTHLTALLWVLAVVGAVNTFGVLVDRMQTPVTTVSRVVDALYTLCVGVLAAVILYKGAA